MPEPILKIVGMTDVEASIGALKHVDPKHSAPCSLILSAKTFKSHSTSSGRTGSYVKLKLPAAQGTNQMDRIAIAHCPCQIFDLIRIYEQANVLSNPALLVDHAKAHSAVARFEIREHLAHR